MVIFTRVFLYLYQCNPLTQWDIYCCAEASKGWRGYQAGTPKTGGCDPEKFFSSNFRKPTFTKV